MIDNNKIEIEGGIKGDEVISSSTSSILSQSATHRTTDAVPSDNDKITSTSTINEEQKQDDTTKENTTTMNKNTEAIENNDINNNDKEQSQQGGKEQTNEITATPITTTTATAATTAPGSFKTNLGNFLSNYYVSPKQPAISLYSGIKNSITMIKDNLPSPPSLVSNSFSTLTSLPLISFVQNNIPFPISYGGSGINNTNNSSGTTPSPSKPSTATTTTTVDTNNNNISTYHPLKLDNIEHCFNEINKRLESPDHSHLTKTIDSFIDMINNQIMNLNNYHQQQQSPPINNQDDTSSTTNTNIIPPNQNDIIQGFSEDICQSIKSFMSTALPMLLNSVAGIPFQSKATASPCISSLQSMTPLDREIVSYEYLEQYITSKIYRRFFSYPPNIEMDTKLCEHISTFQFITPANLDIDPDQFINPNNQLQQQSFEQIQEELLRMTSYKSPRDKLLCIKKSFNSIFKLLSFDNNNNNNNSNNGSNKSTTTTTTPRVIGADLLLPIVIYVLIKSNLPFLLSNIEFISLFREPSLIESEVSYYFVTLITATTFIQNMTMNSLTIINQESPKTSSVETDQQPQPSIIKEGTEKEKDSLPEVDKKHDDKDKKKEIEKEITPQLQQQQQQQLPLTPLSQQDEIKVKQKQWKYYKRTVEELSIKDLRQLMTDFNQLVDYWYQNNNSSSSNNDNDNNDHKDK